MEGSGRAVQSIRFLVNEKYIGNNVWGRTAFKLKQHHEDVPQEDWVRADKVFEAIVDQRIFDQAQIIIQTRSHRLSDDEMLELLRTIYEKNGRLTGLIIDEANDSPSSSAFQSRFGSLLRAYTLVGYAPDRDYRYIEINRSLRRLHPVIVQDIVAGIEDCGATVNQDDTTDLLRINDEFTAAIVISRCKLTTGGSARWKIRLDEALKPDITIAVRMGEENQKPHDYYLLPRLDMREAILRMAEYNGRSLDAYRCENLERFYSLTARARLMRAA